MRYGRRFGWMAMGICAVALGCGDDDDFGGRTPDNAGQACTAPTQCYGTLADRSALQGEVVCLDRVSGGYCTHRCQTDADCCAVAGECWSNLLQVCAPFESTGEMYCFLSCEDADVASGAAQVGAPSTIDTGTYCTTYANPAFGCRSTGGGSANRKVCVP
jgi:hypothetical protein